MSAGEEPYFLSLETAHWLHRESLRQHGGLEGVRDAGAIEARQVRRKRLLLRWRR